jgi:hypothetical protein
MIKSRESDDLDNSPENTVEGEIREFVRRDGPTLRRAPEAESEAVANNIGTLLSRDTCDKSMPMRWPSGLWTK